MATTAKHRRADRDPVQAELSCSSAMIPKLATAEMRARPE